MKVYYLLMKGDKKPEDINGSKPQQKHQYNKEAETILLLPSNT